MTLGKAFSNQSLGINADAIKNKYPGSKKASEYTLLENYLTELYYGKGFETKDGFINFSQLEQAYTEKTLATLKNLMEQLPKISADEDITNIAIPEAREYKKIEVGSYLNTYNRLTKAFQSLSNAKTLDATSEAVKTVLEQVIIANKKIITVVDELNKQGIKIGNKDEFYSIQTQLTKGSKIFTDKGAKINFQQIMNIYNIMGHIDALINGTNLVGNLARFLENAIDSTNLNLGLKSYIKMNEQQIISELTKKSIGDRGEGNKLANSDAFIKISKIKVEDKKLPEKDKGQYKLGKYKEIKDNIVFDFSYNATGNGSQLKIDAGATIEIPSKNKTLTPFRISAKNWASNIGNFNEINLLSALARSAGANNTALYTLALLNNKKSDFNEAIKMAKISIAYELVIGLSQQNKLGASEGYIDTLVIKDNSRKRIRVIDPLDVVTSAIEGKALSSLAASIQGFHEGEQHSNARGAIEVLQAHKIYSPGRTKAYLNEHYHYLQNKKVNMRLKFL